MWGCTWGSRQSSAHIREVDAGSITAARTDPGLQTAPLPGVGQEAVLVRRKDGTRPEVFFVPDGRTYSVAVVTDRGPDDEVIGPAEAAAASAPALALAPSVAG
ncbi:hypothetical protein [Streptomyces sp. BE303]|uniref:hypothetical protein n=1 Tax=Streptomyces sp. BE303 TaxID=3002528 RepID=UPI002E774FA3|nr:hypothetical protein [Streptomyces sp. BE303]MED7953894.1 hypothetical protein [Streptomyces sp. BE303]